MARLLVKAIDHTHPDPKVDVTGCFKRGDVVCIMPDDHVWGAAEDLPKFQRIEMPGVSVEALLHLQHEAVQDVSEIMSTAARKNSRLFKLLSKSKQRDTTICRRYKIDLDTQQITDKKRI